MSVLRRQLPVYSPLPARAVLASLGRSDPRPELADALQTMYGAREAILTSSGTAALTLALLAAARMRPGAPCALPAYGCYDLVSAAVGAGVTVNLYDLDPDTLGPEPDSLERALSPGAAALVVVHLFGIPVPMDVMRSAATRAGALLVEDAAQATGGSWRGRPLGSYGDYAILSFGRGKGETGGGGGALLVHGDAPLPPDLRSRLGAGAPTGAAFALKLAAQWALGRPSLYAIPASIPLLRLGETVYRLPEAPRSMSATVARVLKLTRARTVAEAASRRVHATRFRSALGPRAASLAVAPPVGGEPGWLRYPLRLRVSRALAEAGTRLGITAGYPLQLAQLPALGPLLATAPTAPGATRLAMILRTLPTHSRLTPDDLGAIDQWIAGAICYHFATTDQSASDA